MDLLQAWLESSEEKERWIAASKDLLLESHWRSYSDLGSQGGASIRREHRGRNKIGRQCRPKILCANFCWSGVESEEEYPDKTSALWRFQLWWKAVGQSDRKDDAGGRFFLNDNIFDIAFFLLFLVIIRLCGSLCRQNGRLSYLWRRRKSKQGDGGWESFLSTLQNCLRRIKFLQGVQNNVFGAKPFWEGGYFATLRILQAILPGNCHTTSFAPRRGALIKRISNQPQGGEKLWPCVRQHHRLCPD